MKLIPVSEKLKSVGNVFLLSGVIFHSWNYLQHNPEAKFVEKAIGLWYELWYEPYYDLAWYVKPDCSELILTLWFWRFHSSQKDKCVCETARL